MRLLLYTNILIPLLEDDEPRLPPAIRRRLAAPDSIMIASAASLWEIAIKARTGKLLIAKKLAEIPGALDRLGMDPLLITFEHVLVELAQLPPTRDPFDRLLLAQCQVEGLRLVTVDRALAAHPLAWREA